MKIGGVFFRLVVSVVLSVFIITAVMIVVDFSGYLLTGMTFLTQNTFEYQPPNPDDMSPPPHPVVEYLILMVIVPLTLYPLVWYALILFGVLLEIGGRLLFKEVGHVDQRSRVFQFYFYCGVIAMFCAILPLVLTMPTDDFTLRGTLIAAFVLGVSGVIVGWLQMRSWRKEWDRIEARRESLERKEKHLPTRDELRGSSGSH